MDREELGRRHMAGRLMEPLFVVVIVSTSMARLSLTKSMDQR